MGPIALRKLPLRSIQRREHARSERRKVDSRGLVLSVSPILRRFTSSDTISKALSPADDRYHITFVMRLSQLQLLTLVVTLGNVFTYCWLDLIQTRFMLDCLDLNSWFWYLKLPLYEAIRIIQSLPLYEAVSWNAWQWSRRTFVLLASVAMMPVPLARNLCYILIFTTLSSLILLPCWWIYPQTLTDEFCSPNGKPWGSMDFFELTSTLPPLPSFMSQLACSHSTLVYYPSCPGTTTKIVASQVLNTTEHVSFPSLTPHRFPSAYLSLVVSSTAECRPPEEFRDLLDCHSHNLEPLKTAPTSTYPPCVVGLELKRVLLKSSLLTTVFFCKPAYLPATSEADPLALKAPETSLSHGDTDRNCQDAMEATFVEGSLTKPLVMFLSSPLSPNFNYVVLSCILCLINMLLKALVMLVLCSFVMYSFNGE